MVAGDAPHIRGKLYEFTRAAFQTETPHSAAYVPGNFQVSRESNIPLCLRYIAHRKTDTQP